jgi:formylglycine-generating enzyme required for sulfatase activity
MIKISGASFTMGSGRSDAFHLDDETQRKVQISEFYMGTAEVTVAEFKEFTDSTGYRTWAEKNGKSIVARSEPADSSAMMVTNGVRWINVSTGLEEKPGLTWSHTSFTQDETQPVTNVNWFDAVEYCNWRSRQERLTPVYTVNGSSVRINDKANGYRLPTEAEWEYACRAGTTALYNFDNENVPLFANFFESFIYKSVPSTKYQPNKWGLYAMHGNVFEWCQDNYETTKEKVIKGGAWFSSQPVLRSAFRGSADPSISIEGIGFRIVRSAR